MAEKKITIVIKKIDGGAAGGHGGSWKVAFADFMTAMMCFFLVMWLTAQSAEVKSDVASYFSGPSMLEHDFTSYGAELTLEKLFLDLVNEPLKTAQDFLQPADFTPNVMAMGSKKIVLQFVAEELGDAVRNVDIESDHIEFDIPERTLFEPGSADPSSKFVDTMGKLQAVTIGLEDSRINIESVIYQETVPDRSYNTALHVSTNRKDLIGLKIRGSFEKNTNQVTGSASVKNSRSDSEPGEGYIRIRVAQKELTADGKKPRQLEDLFEKDHRPTYEIYNDFVKRLAKDKPKSKPKSQKY